MSQRTLLKCCGSPKYVSVVVSTNTVRKQCYQTETEIDADPEMHFQQKLPYGVI